MATWPRIPRIPRHTCPGDGCPICEPAIAVAEDWQAFPDPADAPRGWEP